MRNADVFDAFYDASVVRITAQMYPIIGSRVATEECVREAYARAWERWGPVSRRADLEALIRIVALRVSMYGWYRWHSVAGGRSRPPETEAPQPPVVQQLRQLQAAERQVIVLHYLVGKPVEQVAREVGIPVGTVRARLSRGVPALASLPGDPGALLTEAAAGLAATMVPSPAHLVRQRGDSRRRANALRTVAAVLVLAVIGGAVFLISASGSP